MSLPVPSRKRIPWKLLVKHFGFKKETAKSISEGLSDPDVLSEAIKSNIVYVQDIRTGLMEWHYGADLRALETEGLFVVMYGDTNPLTNKFVLRYGIEMPISFMQRGYFTGGSTGPERWDHLAYLITPMNNTGTSAKGRYIGKTS